MVKICPKCGASDKDKQFAGSFCIDCVHIELKLPPELIIEVCKDDNTAKFQGKKTNFTPKLVEQFIATKTKGDFESLSYDEENKEVEYIINLAGNLVQLRRPLKLIIRPVLSIEASRRHGGYYEATIQLRGDPDKIAKYEKRITRFVVKDSFIAKVSVLKEGVDLQIGSKAIAIDVLKRLGLKSIRTSTLAGLKNCKKVYRDTFSVRF